MTNKSLKAKKKFSLVFLLIVFTNSFSQSTIDSINYALKVNNYNSALLFANKLENRDLQFLFLKKINHYLRDNRIDTLGLYRITIPKNRDSILYKSLIADIYTLGKSKRIEIYNSYFQAYKKYLVDKDTLLINESLKKLCDYIIYNARNDTIKLNKYVNELKRFKKDEVDNFWISYYGIQYNFFIKDFKQNTKSLNDSLVPRFRGSEMKSLFKELHDKSNSNKHHRAIYFTMLGAYQGDWLREYTESNKSFLKSKDLYNDLNNIQARRSVATLENNIAINYFKKNEFEKAIPYFKKSLIRDKKQLYKMFTNEWLYKCYNNLKQSDSALFYFKKMTEVKDELKLIENTRQIITMETKYDYDEIVKNLEKETREKKELKSTLYTIVPILGLTTLILTFIFYLYKRYKKKSNFLEEEQSETLQKLDELKNIVIKNHIVLKDKTKVYISDLMYVKSDDHYLEVVTQNDKKRTVRGMLSQIKEELPPNFIQCHRSYIVNSNFIKQINSTSLVLINKEQIPLSRSYKNKF